MRSFAAVPLVVLFAACGSSMVGGRDVGRFDDEDAGESTTFDAGRPDAGQTFDAGEAPDAADGIDAGGGTKPDAGDTIDAGGDVDAGTIDPPDAGPREFPWTTAPAPHPTEWFSATPACQPSDWLAKYFAYRVRLRGDGTGANPGFVSLGHGPGQGMVAGMRQPTADCNGHWLMTNCRKDIPTNANGFYLWGDGTVWLGWYLQTLATEYEAFRILGLDTTETLRDLGTVLNAFNRLDEQAETLFNVTPRRDGFFLRDDVGHSFIFSDPVNRTPRFPRADGLSAYGCIVSGGACDTQTTEDGDFISQDQFIEMLPGLALIAKYVPESVVVENVRPGENLNPGREAKAIVDRVLRYFLTNDWLIKDPNGVSPPNQWGGSARSYSYPIGKAANRIVNGALGISDYLSAPGYASANAIALVNLATWTAADTSWPLQTLNNQAMILALGTTSGLWSLDKLVTRSSDWGAPTFPMEKHLLDGGAGLPPGVSERLIESMLTTAPCGGPCHLAAGCEEVPGWMGEHRFKSPEDRSGDVYGYIGEYPGIDYMLLHNLYVIAKNGRRELTWPTPPRCRGAPKVTQWQEVGPSAGATFDPWDGCDTRDFEKQFCGRSFAQWLDDAYAGRAKIRFKNGELQCSGRDACVVVPAGSFGTDAVELYIGDGSNDVFDGAGGDDCLVGNTGDDELSGDRGEDELHGGPGHDTLCGEGCNISQTLGENDLLFGGDGNDSINGGPGIDNVYAGAGNDTVRGDQAEDTIFGGEGDDDLDGEMGGDQVFGGEGNDRVVGGMGDDKLFGGDGNDVVLGGLGSDSLRGDNGRDKLDGQDGDDSINGGPGDDLLFGDAGDDRLSGEEGNDRLCGGCGKDALDGGWETGTDQCRAQSAFPLTCFTDSGESESNCDLQGFDKELCREDAWDAW